MEVEMNTSLATAQFELFLSAGGATFNQVMPQLLHSFSTKSVGLERRGKDGRLSSAMDDAPALHQIMETMLFIGGPRVASLLNGPVGYGLEKGEDAFTFAQKISRTNFGTGEKQQLERHGGSTTMKYTIDMLF